MKKYEPLIDTSGHWIYSKTGKRLRWTEKDFREGDYAVVGGKLQKIVRIGKNTDGSSNYIFKDVRKSRKLRKVS